VCRYGVRVTDPWTMRPVPIVERAADRAAYIFPLVTDWLLSEPMAELLEAFGERLPPPGFASNHDDGDPNGWLHLNEKLPEWLLRVAVDPAASVNGLSPAQVDILRRTLAVERMVAADFNFRASAGQQYRERIQASTADFTPEFRARVRELAGQLGLVHAQEPRASGYDKTLVLGGGYRSPLLRARYAALLRSKGFQLGEVSFLGSPRFLIEDPPERSVTDAYAPGASDEFDLLVAAAQTEFGLTPARTTFLCGCSSAQAACPKWLERHPEGGQTPAAYTHERRAELEDDAGRTVASVLSASTGRPPYRPDTSDTFSLWGRCANPQLGQRVLVVTSQVFVPFQSFDGVRRLYLPHGVDLDAVGYGDDWEESLRTAEYLLQETLSAIRSGRRLLVDAAGTLMGAAIDKPSSLGL
jgi:hypothetical protein